MGRLIIKAAKDRDLYCEWSTIVDAPTFIGDRESTLAALRQDDGRRHPGFSPDPGNRPEDRLARCDETGTSAHDQRHEPWNGGKYPPEGHWEDSGFIWEQRGWLPRERLADALDWALASDHGADIPSAMLDPFDDPDDPHPVLPAQWEREGGPA